MATVPVELLNTTGDNSDASDLRGPVREDCLGNEDEPSPSSWPLRPARSAVVRNFLSSSARVVGEAPLILVPFMIVMLSVFG
jgi:hypothetical protein